MPKLSTTELGAILNAQKADALSGESTSKLSDERSAAMDYYLGDVSEDMPTVEGRSRAVSTDVADTIEGLMPSLMEVFCGSDEVVKFDPVSSEDVEAAEQETDYVNHVFMQQNPGFLVLYSFIKDALLQKNGFVKVYPHDEEKEERETYYDQPDDAYAVIVSTPDVEVVEHSERQTEYGTLHDVTVSCKKNYSRACVEPVPPEEFGIARNAKNLRDCDYCYHEVIKSEGKLIEGGYDKAQVQRLPSYTVSTGREATSRDTVDESGNPSDVVNRALRQIRVTEHYSKLDYEGDRVALYRVTTGGEAGEVLTRKGEPEVVEVDMIPFAAMTPVIMTHRFYGRSIADLVMDIMRIKTALVRGALDNLYLHNNPRVVVSEQGANENTLDDLLVSRPGGVVRVKGSPNEAVSWQVVPDITQATYPALQYWDSVREWRTGVTRQGQGIDADALQNQTATAANQLYSAAQARMRLIARIFAETGVKDLFWLLHATLRKYGKQRETVRLRNKWVTVDPRDWKSRNDMTISVGLGTGGKEQQLAFLQLIIGAQEKAVALGMVSKNNFYNSAKELVKLIGRKDPEAFFTAPNMQPDQNDPASAPIEAPTDPKVMQIQMQSQLDAQSDQRKAEIETVQMQADIAAKRDQTQAEMMRDDREHQLKKELAVLEFQLERELKMAELEMKREMHQQTLAQNAEQHRQQIEAGVFKAAAGAEAHQQKMQQNEAKSEAGP